MRGIDSGRWFRASDHLDHVLDLPAQDQAAFLASLRVDNPETAADVEALLDEHRRLSAEGFLDAAPPIKPLEPALAGVTIGAYTLVSPIGHGGMGSVWLASRSDGLYEGQAALKLLNAALVGRGGEERFKREGTILARLTHPHIARLIDAGVSATGQPYLVLEHIAGRHIDRYCDEAHLGVEARIRLFLDVLSAVAHAHANLIVHRDVKPSNVLVNHDGQVKLLDFSIAKLIEDESGEQGATILTRDAGSALTPKYAAPEQVLGGTITTATDVYALGVLLYELLSGQHPAGAAPKSPSDFVKAIAESEPIRLSAALNNPAPEIVAALAARRDTTADGLRRTLRGDLETILGKALKKDPAERYVSVAEFADDLRRFVNHQPIGARPDAVGYRAAKFVRRHWRGIAVGAVAATLLVGLVGFYTARLAAERDRARLQAEKASRISELLTRLLTGADPYRTPDAKEPTVQNLLDIAAERAANELGDQPELQAEMFTVIGRTYERMGLFAKALPLQERALAVGRAALGEHVSVAAALNNLGVLHREMGDLAAAEPLLVESLAMRRRLLGNIDKDVAVTLVELARVQRDRGRSAESEAPTREALAIRKQVFGDEHRETATSKSELALLLWERGNLDEAEQFARENLATSARVLGADHPNAAAAKAQLALVLRDKGELAAAEPLFRESLAAERRQLGERHPEIAVTLNNLGMTLELQGRLDEAQSLLEEAVQIALPPLTDQHPRVAVFMINLARIEIERGRAVEAEAAVRHVLVLRQRILPATSWRIAQAQSLLGAVLLEQKKYADAEPLMLAADRVLAPTRGQQGREREANRARLVTLYERTGRSEQASQFR